MDDKILWDIIDGLRDELNIAQDGITDLNDVVKDLQADNRDLWNKLVLIVIVIVIHIHIQ